MQRNKWAEQLCCEIHDSDVKGLFEHYTDMCTDGFIFIIQDFSTPSLHGEFSRVNEEQQQVEDEEADDIVRYQIEERKKWEQRYKCMNEEQ